MSVLVIWVDAYVENDWIIHAAELHVYSDFILHHHIPCCNTSPSTHPPHPSSLTNRSDFIFIILLWLIYIYQGKSIIGHFLYWIFAAYNSYKWPKIHFGLRFLYLLWGSFFCILSRLLMTIKHGHKYFISQKTWKILVFLVIDACYAYRWQNNAFVCRCYMCKCISMNSTLNDKNQNVVSKQIQSIWYYLF